MNWKDTAEQAAFRSDVRAFMRERFPESYRPDTAMAQSLEPEDVYGYNWAADCASADAGRREGALAWARALAERGWIAPRFPREYGGAGLDAMREFILHEEMAGARVPPVNGIGVNLLGPTLLAHGSEVQKRVHLPQVARGEVTWAQGFSEPGAGSDLASLTTRAVREGDNYIVNGQKVWTSLVQHSAWAMVLVRTDTAAARPHHGISYLLVDLHAPGVTVRPIEDLRGGTPFGEIFFEDVRVPLANRVGDENRGWYVAMTTLGYERAGLGSTLKFQRMLDRLIDCLRGEDGRKFARPDRQMLRHEVMQRQIEIRVLYNLARYSVSRTAAGEAPDYEASVSQLFGAELHQRLAGTGMKVFGRYAQLIAPQCAPLEAMYARDFFSAIAHPFLGGSSEIQRTVIATRGLKLPRN